MKPEYTIKNNTINPKGPIRFAMTLTVSTATVTNKTRTIRLVNHVNTNRESWFITALLIILVDNSVNSTIFLHDPHHFFGNFSHLPIPFFFVLLLLLLLNFSEVGFHAISVVAVLIAIKISYEPSSLSVSTVEAHWGKKINYPAHCYLR